MIPFVDDFLDRTTMYRVVLYVLIGLLVVAAVLTGFNVMPFSTWSLLVSTAFLWVMCWATNVVLSHILEIPANVESTTITALILALIVDPATSFNGFTALGWVAILAMSSKYLIAVYGKHLFNPAAIAVVITGFVIGEPASWWVGTSYLLPFALVASWLVVRKLRQESMAITFVIVAVIGVGAVSVVQHLSLGQEMQQLLVYSPLFFFAGIMLTEPMTSPPTRQLRVIYAVIVGLLFVPQVHVGKIYSTPELALVVGNLFSYAVSPKFRLDLRLKRRTRLSPDIAEFAFAPARAFAYQPGQYMEFTLAHTATDSRGNRRYFTLASSPTEPLVRLGVRFYETSSSFKRTLKSLKPNSMLVAGQLAGDFTLPRDKREKLVFIAGGIGITPFRSMLKYLADTNQRRDIVVLYANSTPDDFVYRDVLAEAQTKVGIKVLYTITNHANVPREWTGFAGRVTAQMIRDALPDVAERTFYLSGPPRLIRGVEHALHEVGVHRSRIKTDFFPGLV